MQFKTGFDFEEAVFGCRSSGDRLVNRFLNKRVDLSDGVRRIIQTLDIKHPPTAIGEYLYNQMLRHLVRLGINPEELVFLPSVDTEVDFCGVDGLFFLPSLFPCFVMIDVFNISPRQLLAEREIWIDTFPGREYSELDYRSDLWLFKRGMNIWKKENKEALELEAQGKGSVIRPKDFRQFADKGRVKNHFIFTPLDTRRCKDFSRIIAEYFANSKETGCKNMAQQSP